MMADQSYLCHIDWWSEFDLQQLRPLNTLIRVCCTSVMNCASICLIHMIQP